MSQSIMEPLGVYLLGVFSGISIYYLVSTNWNLFHALQGETRIVDSKIVKIKKNIYGFEH